MKTSKKLNRNRLLRIESLEEREMLTVTAGDFAAIKSQYADLGLTNYADYNIIEVTADQLSETALRDIENKIINIAQNPTALDDYLVVLRTTATRNTVAIDATFTINAGSSIDTLAIVSYGDELLTIDAQQKCRIFQFSTYSGSSYDYSIALGGLALVNGNSPNTGGAIMSSANNLLMTHCVVANNQATYGAGGIYAAGRTTITNSSIINNSASGYGGGICYIGSYSNGGNTLLTIRNCTIAENTADVGGGIYSAMQYGAQEYTADIRITNCTIVENTATVEAVEGDDYHIYGGGGIYLDMENYNPTDKCRIGEDFNVAIHNNIIVNNDSASKCNDIFWRVGAYELDDNNQLIEVDYTGNEARYANSITDNIIQDSETLAVADIDAAGSAYYRITAGTPSNQFSSAAYAMLGERTQGANGQYYYPLLAESPAVNNGDYRYVSGAPYDIIGGKRIVGGVVDIGAYEYSNIIVVGTPTNFKAVQNGKNVVLTWDAASNATTYRIGRWNDVTKKWVDLSKACTNLTLTNNNVTPGTHKYLLRAYNGTAYGNSVTVSIDVKETTATVGTPTNFKAVQSGKNVVLTWSAASNAATYRIGRWNDVTKKWVDLSKACTNLTLTNNNVSPGTHKYLLRAYNGTSYGNSVTVSITVKGTAAVGTPTNFKAVQSGKNVVLTWSAASNAATYRIGRWNDVTGKWVDLSKACTNLTLTNNNVTPGTHRYLLRAYNGTSYGNSVTVSIDVKGTTTTVGTPTNFKAVQNGKNVVLTWSAASNAATYRIGRWNDVTKKWVDLSKACTNLTLTNNNVTPGTHKYLLRAYNGTAYGNSVTVSIDVNGTAALSPLEAVFVEYGAEYE